MAAAARQEHLAFGSQSLDAQGRLVRAGSAEAEDDGRSWRGAAPWQRVLRYWEAVGPPGPHLPAAVRWGGLRPADRWRLGEALEQAGSERLQGLGVGPDQGLQSHEILAVRAALARVAVIDTPWSAAFVSWLARRAGLGAGEFAFSEAHADYAAAARAADRAERDGRPTAYALRACDLALTPPRVGDLVCQARGSRSSLERFDALAEALDARSAGPGGAALPMH
ncbi:MAG: DUF2272 domain-containing protein, partial [Comamonadaceae bacterium]